MQRYLKLVTPAAALAGGYFAGYAAAPKVQEATGALDIAPPELVGHKRTQVEGGSFSTRMREAEEKQREEGAPARRQEVWFGFKEIRGGIGELYDIKQQVGEGSFGRTYVAVDKKTGREVALKILPKQMISCADSIEDVDREVEIMKQLNGHENVISFHQAFEDKKAVFISMELCRGGELFDAVQESKGNYTEREAADIIRQILSVLAHCHINGIVYCDVKPENFLYLDKKQKVLKAIDFGLSRHFTPLGRALRKPRGTAYYVAPEVMRCEYGPEADMWSAGIIAYLLLTGEVPFCGDTETDILKQVMTGKSVDYSDGKKMKKLSPLAKGFLKGLLERDVGLRMTAVQALSHPWLRDTCPPTEKGELVMDAAAVSSLHAFAKYGRMRKLALRAVAGVVANSGIIDTYDLKSQFMYLDKDDSNLISTEELQAALEKTTWKHTDKEMRELLESLHCYTYGTFRRESTGAKMEFVEFLAATMSIKQLRASIDKKCWLRIIREAFSYFDVDGDGVISGDDLRSCFCDPEDRGGLDDLVRECMEEGDVTRTGKITLEDFVALLHMHDPSLSSRYGYVKTPQNA